MNKPDFVASIAAMNAMYKLPVNEQLTSFPGEPLAARVHKFQRTMLKEVNETDALIDKLYASGDRFEALIDVADLLGDIVVYCYSEAAKYGIPLDTVLAIIMRSNATKLGGDGKPIYDENGKFCKGPNFQPPEPEIRTLFKSLLALKAPNDE
jgi:predicted HAD superfamily Cof-like phosphohydrolase